MASRNSNAPVHQLSEDDLDGATPQPVARPLDLRPGQRPRPWLSLPQREIWGGRRRHRTEDTPAEYTVPAMLAKTHAERVDRRAS